MSCQDDAALTGPVALFLGVETASWNVQQFTDAANFAKAHGITTLFIKVFEVGSKAGNVWYGGINGWDTIYQAIQNIVNVIPYGFLYGDTYGNLSTEINIAVQFQQKYQKLCLDMEGSYWTGQNGATWAKQIADALTPLPDKLWLSYPADFVQNNQQGFIQAISPAVNVFMPMAYSDYLTSVWQSDLSQVNPQACVQPTLDLSQEFGANNVLGNIKAAKQAGCLAISLWEYGFAKSNPGLLDSVVTEFTGQQSTTGGTSSMVALNSKGEVADFVDVSQMEANESEFACGYFAAGECKFAGQPGKGPTGSAEQLDQWADVQGGAVTGGVSIDDMHTLFHAAGLHYWDTDISPNTQQSHDIATIKAALVRGYPVVATVAETSVFDLDLNGNPYAPNWTPSGNHVFVYTGIASDGNLLVHDSAAIQGGIFGKLLPQPRRYRANSLENHWASIVQLPWLPSIESGDPLSWKAPIQVTQPVIPGGWRSTDQEAIAKAEWDSTNTGAPFDSGIALAWVVDYQNGIYHGPPLNKEQPVKSWDGQDMVMQVFAGARCEWTGKAHWYSLK